MEKVLNILLGYVGYLEKKSNKDLEHKTKNAGKNNYTIFAKLYKDYTGNNFQGQAWCAMFISVCFVLAYGLDKAKELLCGSLYSYCPYGMSAFQKKGQLHSKPKAGDIVFFIRNGVAKHTGFVYKVSGNTIYTIEGNTSGASGVVANGGGVCKKSYTVNSNMRFGRPKYTDEPKTETTPATTPTTTTTKKGSGYMFQPETVKKGSKGNSVLLVQEILRARGIKGADGKDLSLDKDCGNNTVHAINSYQSARRKDGVELGTNKKNDGACGKKMWADLIGL